MIRLPRFIHTQFRTSRDSHGARRSPIFRTAPLLSRLAFLALALVVFALGSCVSPTAPSPYNTNSNTSTNTATQSAAPHLRGPLLAQITGQPRVRVRLAADMTKAVIAARSPIRIGPDDAKQQRNVKYFASPVTITRKDGAFIITAGNGAKVRWALSSLRLSPVFGGTLTFEKQSFPHLLVLNALVVNHKMTSHFNVVNYLALESYLPGVISQELYGSWKPAAYEAQAIAARSYAIYEISLHPDRSYDLQSTPASQVYGGTTTNPTALHAVEETRGQVLVWNNRVVPAFYSSTCGGRGQDVTAAFPDVVDIPPLHARDHGDWCQDSPKYRWGPIDRNKTHLAQRIADWSQQNGYSAAALQNIAAIQVSARSQDGRPAAFMITDADGSQYELPCEKFRFACDDNTPTLPHVAPLPSSDCTVTITGDTVQFANGRGFGHGVGLCQFGAQAMAAAGYQAPAILSFYYPGAEIKTVY